MSRALVVINRMSDRDLLRPNFEGPESKTCRECGDVFSRDKRCTWAHWNRVRFCSRQCVGRHNSKVAAAHRPPLREYFEQQIRKTDDCWEWTGARDKDGYGVLRYEGTNYRAPVLALEFDGRPVPKGMYACHTCDNPGCIRPDHLYPGTPTQNMQDARERGRLRAGSRSHWSKLTEDDVRAIRSDAAPDHEVATRYGVSRANITLIRQRKTWKHVE